MTTNEALQPITETTFVPAHLGIPSDAISRKEQELSSLLDRVLEKPFAPIREALTGLVGQVQHSGQELTKLAEELSAIDDNVSKIRRMLKSHDEQLEELKHKLDLAAKAASAATQAEVKRDAELLSIVQAYREDAQQAAQTATRSARKIMALIAILMLILAGQISFTMWG